MHSPDPRSAASSRPLSRASTRSGVTGPPGSDLRPSSTRELTDFSGRPQTPPENSQSTLQAFGEVATTPEPAGARSAVQRGGLMALAIYMAIRLSSEGVQDGFEGHWFARWWVVVADHPLRSSLALTLLFFGLAPARRLRTDD